MGLRGMKVWLVANNSPFPAGPEGSQVRAGIRGRLATLFGRVVGHANARSGRPSTMSAAVDVQWSDLSNPADVGDRDVVIYFSPRATSATAAPQTVERNAYLTAARALRDTGLRNQMVTAITGGFRAGGITRRASIGNRQVPTLSEVFVLYDAQFSQQQMRVDTNVETYAVAAFHEAAHNKADNSSAVHGAAAGGGAFAATYRGQQVNARNIAYLAQYIWNWRPQYIRGQPLTPRQP